MYCFAATYLACAHGTTGSGTVGRGLQSEDAVVVFARSCGSVCNKPPTHSLFCLSLPIELQTEHSLVCHHARSSATCAYARKLVLPPSYKCQQDVFQTQQCRWAGGGNSFADTIYSMLTHRESCKRQNLKTEKTVTWFDAQCTSWYKWQPSP